MDHLDIWGTTAGIVSFTILIPYFALGFYTLRRRYAHHEELSPHIEALVLFGVAMFYALESFLLRSSMKTSPAYYFFAILGLIVSGAALYGPMAISLVSQVLVDLIIPGERSKTMEPRYEPAEALERELDFEGAIREYLVIARVFPREPNTFLRIAELYLKLEQFEEAAAWFERALKLLDSAEKSLQITNRVCEIYQRKLGRPDAAGPLLEAYLAKYPDAEFSGSVRDRLAKVRNLNAEPVPSAS